MNRVGPLAADAVGHRDGEGGRLDQRSPRVGLVGVAQQLRRSPDVLRLRQGGDVQPCGDAVEDRVVVGPQLHVLERQLPVDEHRVLHRAARGVGQVEPNPARAEVGDGRCVAALAPVVGVGRLSAGGRGHSRAGAAVGAGVVPLVDVRREVALVAHLHGVCVFAAGAVPDGHVVDAGTKACAHAVARAVVGPLDAVGAATGDGDAHSPVAASVTGQVVGPVGDAGRDRFGNREHTAHHASGGVRHRHRMRPAAEVGSVGVGAGTRVARPGVGGWRRDVPAQHHRRPSVAVCDASRLLDLQVAKDGAERHTGAVAGGAAYVVDDVDVDPHVGVALQRQREFVAAAQGVAAVASGGPYQGGPFVHLGPQHEGRHASVAVAQHRHVGQSEPHLLSHGVAAAFGRHHQGVQPAVVDVGVGNRAVAHAARPPVGAAQHGVQPNLDAPTAAGGQRVQRIGAVAQHQHLPRRGVRHRASARQGGDKLPGVQARLGVDMRGLSFGGCGPVAKVPLKVLAASRVVELDCVGGAVGHRLHKLGHGVAVVDAQSKHRIVAVAAFVVPRVGSLRGRERVAAAAAGAHGLVEVAQFVEAAGAAVHVVVSAVEAAA